MKVRNHSHQNICSAPVAEKSKIRVLCTNQNCISHIKGCIIGLELVCCFHNHQELRYLHIALSPSIHGFQLMDQDGCSAHTICAIRRVGTKEEGEVEGEKEIGREQIRKERRKKMLFNALCASLRAQTKSCTCYFCLCPSARTQTCGHT